MEVLRASLLALYCAALGLFSLYGLHRLHLLVLLVRNRRRSRVRRPLSDFTRAPVVTVQIPLYNEGPVASRLLEAVSHLDYPRDRLEVQVLDDSTDGTSCQLAIQIEDLRRRGHDVHHLRRPVRSGFKAGALAAGLSRARGEFVAVFDADFVPGPAFLRETLPQFDDPGVGMVQARWGHLNRNHSWLTRVQALLLDGHFLIEHAARSLSGRFFNFNGTAGIWRRRCVEDAGGWQQDTLTEDLDLSYRAQLAGWRFAFLPTTVAPGELPVDVSAFKVQQHRWAKGSIQTARKILPRLLAAPLPWRVRAEACLHLTANAGYVLMVAFSVLLLPVMVLRVGGTGWPLSLLFDLPVLALSTLSFWIFYAAAEIEGGSGASRALRTMPVLMAVGVGLSLNNARAVLEGLFGGLGTFERTPKYRIEDGLPLPPRAGDRAGRISLPWLEGAFALYLGVSLAIAVLDERWTFVPFLLLFCIGYAAIALASLNEAARFVRSRRSAPEAPGGQDPPGELRVKDAARFLRSGA